MCKLLFHALVSTRDVYNGQKTWGLQNPLRYWSLLSSSPWGSSSSAINCPGPVTSLPPHAALHPAGTRAGGGPAAAHSTLNGTFLSCLRHLFHRHPPPSPCFPLFPAGSGTAAPPQAQPSAACLPLLLLLLLMLPPAASTCEQAGLCVLLAGSFPAAATKAVFIPGLDHIRSQSRTAAEQPGAFRAV